MKRCVAFCLSSTRHKRFLSSGQKAKPFFKSSANATPYVFGGSLCHLRFFLSFRWLVATQPPLTQSFIVVAEASTIVIASQGPGWPRPGDRVTKSTVLGGSAEGSCQVC